MEYKNNKFYDYVEDYGYEPDDSVVAWQELPKPYQKESEEE